MMESIDIRENVTWRREAEMLYRRSFPIIERKSVMSLRRMASEGSVDSTAYIVGGRLCGVSYSMPCVNLVFLMYLAVSEDVRGLGYGTRILDSLKGRYSGKTLFLSAEVPDDDADNSEQRSRRVGFYERNGILWTDTVVTWRGVKYGIMSTDAGFTISDYEGFWEDARTRRYCFQVCCF